MQNINDVLTISKALFSTLLEAAACRKELWSHEATRPLGGGGFEGGGCKQKNLNNQ